MVSVGRSVCSYVCAHLLSTRANAALQKESAFAPPSGRPDSSSSKDSRLHKRIALERKRYYNASVYLARISIARAAALALYSRLTNRWNVC